MVFVVINTNYTQFSIHYTNVGLGSMVLDGVNYRLVQQRVLLHSLSKRLKKSEDFVPKVG